MSSMSTPVSDLPRSDGPTPPLDTSVVDVLEEMEREVAAQACTPPPVHAPPPAPGLYAPQAMPMASPMYIQDDSGEWVSMPKLRTAVMATLLAMLLLLPRFPGLYDRFTRLAFLEPYELYIRAGMLALVLYLLMVHLDL